VLADTDYRVEIVVFGDSALADTLQQSSGNLRFDARTVRDIEKRVEREDREDKRAEETRTREPKGRANAPTGRDGAYAVRTTRRANERRACSSQSGAMAGP